MGSEIGDNIHPHSQGYFADETCSAAADVAAPQSGIMQKFCLYETHSNFYMVGRNKGRTYWRVLKIDRLDSSELNVLEDPTIYTRRECSDLLRRIDEGNRSTGGLKFVTKCYGIVGFIKFLGPYYMLLITERKAIGAICGHTIYAVSKSEILPLPNPAVLEDVATSKNENRYKKILCNVDLTKDFFFSYSYHVMCNFQKNMCDNVEEKVIYETSFVWNEFLTRGIRNLLKNTLWTVALVYGFYKQSADDKCLTLLPLPVLYNTEVPSFVEYQATQSFSGRDIKLILIARRSRHYAGTRYLKRGVNEHGRVANDVETEQIVFEDASEGFPLRISSVVQNRGSIPLFWSQDTSRLNLKPDIILSKRDQTYQATRLHFDDLIRRYGNPIIILNLIKTHEKRPRESILRTEFANAIEVINKDLSEDNNLKFIHWDLNKHSKSQATDVLQSLGKVASHALALTGFFYCQVTPGLVSEGSVNWSHFKNFVSFNKSLPRHQDINKERHSDNDDKDAKDVETILIEENNVADEVCCVKPPVFQKGVLRTNCIDCLDRTNVAQYAYGLIALGQQLNALGVKDSPKIDLDDPLADYLMTIYERMGDTLAHQYGGSAAHNKIFSQRRGQWKAATQSQEFFRTLQRYYSNAYMDAEKQSAINLFLGNFQPQHGKPQVWELNYNQHYDVYQNAQQTIDEDRRSFIKRSISDGSILRGSRPPGSVSNEDLTKAEESRQGRSESTPDVTDMSCSRYTPQPHCKEHCGDMQKSRSMAYDNRDASDYSNFIDLDWLSSSSSCEEELDRSTVMNSSAATLSTESLGKELVGETIPSTSAYGSSMKRREITGTELSCDEGQNHEAPDEFSDSFVRWVTQGETLCF